jgi:hypothetical protein
VEKSSPYLRKSSPYLGKSSPDLGKSFPDRRELDDDRDRPPPFRLDSSPDREPSSHCLSK